MTVVESILYETHTGPEKRRIERFQRPRGQCFGYFVNPLPRRLRASLGEELLGGVPGHR